MNGGSSEDTVLGSNMQPVYRCIVEALFFCFATCALRNPGLKTWWTNRVTDDIFSAGRLTEMQVKQAADDGFKSIISTCNFTDRYQKGDDTVPTTTEAIDIAENLAGIPMTFIIECEDEWRSRSVFDRLGAAIADAPKPVLVHCRVGYSALFHPLLIATKQLIDSGKEDDKAAIEIFYKKAVALGYDFAEDEILVELVANVTGVTTEQPARTNVVPDIWFMTYWEVKPVFMNWFAAGQIQRNSLNDINKEYKAVINVRKGVVVPPNRTPSQEEVALLNIRDITGTYKSGGRQSVTRLEATRIKKDRPKEFISKTSPVNYQSRNALQFGDGIGYNETEERLTIEAADYNFTYYHLPIGGQYQMSQEMYKVYKGTLEKAGERGPVIVHCDNGLRAVVMALLGAGTQNKLSSTWALQQASDMGYVLDNDHKALLQDVLGSTAASYNSDIFWLFILCSVLPIFA